MNSQSDQNHPNNSPLVDDKSAQSRPDHAKYAKHEHQHTDRRELHLQNGLQKRRQIRKHDGISRFPEKSQEQTAYDDEIPQYLKLVFERNGSVSLNLGEPAENDNHDKQTEEAQYEKNGLPAKPA